MNPYLMISMEFGPKVARRLLEKIPSIRWDEVLEPGRFCAREAIAHLADWEPIWLQRLEIGVQHPGSTIVVYDEDQMSRDGNYAGRDAIAEAQRFAEGRAQVAQYLRSLKDSDWDKTVEHPERGTLSVSDMANMILGHDMYHLEQFSQYL